MKVLDKPLELYEKKFAVELSGLELAIIYSVLGPTSNESINNLLVRKNFSEMPKISSQPISSTPDYMLYQEIGKLIGRNE